MRYSGELVNNSVASFTNIHRSRRATHVVLAVVSFVLSFVPFSGDGASPLVKRSQPFQTEWIIRQRAVARRVTYRVLRAVLFAEVHSSYSRFNVQHYTRVAALAIATYAQHHAPPAPLYVRSNPASDHEDPLLVSASV